MYIPLTPSTIQPSLFTSFIYFQAVIGVAFSVGFVFGPMFGALFSRYTRDQQENFYVLPAMFALVLAIIDIFYIIFMFKETLPEHRRVGEI